MARMRKVSISRRNLLAGSTALAAGTLGAPLVGEERAREHDLERVAGADVLLRAADARLERRVVNLLAAICRKTVHDERVALGELHERLVDLITLERFKSRGGFRLLAH